MKALSRRLPEQRTRFGERFKWSPRVGHMLDLALERLEAVTQGLPQLHQHTHLQGGSDAFTAPGTPATIDPNLGPTAGTATNYARANVRPGIDLKLTTKGDSLTRSSSAYVREAVGADGTVLTADSTQATGRRWVTPATPVSAADAADAAADAAAGGSLKDFELRQSVEVYAHRVSLAKNFR